MRAPLRRWASTARPAAYRRRHAAAASDLRKRLYALVRGRGRGEKVTADVAEVAQRLPEVVQSAQLYHVADICRMMAQLNAPRCNPPGPPAPPPPTPHLTLMPAQEGLVRRRAGPIPGAAAGAIGR